MGTNNILNRKHYKLLNVTWSKMIVIYHKVTQIKY
jgi:hypothetical protein